MKKHKSQSELVVEFVVPRFNFYGEEYTSAEVQEKARNGDKDSIRIINHLIEIKSGVISVITDNQ